MKTFKFKFLFLITLVAFVSCSMPTTAYASETVDREIWWRSTEDDASLRKRFNELNDKYFDGNLKVKYIRYGDGLILDNLSGATYYWNERSRSEEYAGQSVITLDRKFVEENPDELDGLLLHEMCHVFANMYDKGSEVEGTNGHELLTYKIMIRYLVQIGANPRLGEGVVKLK